MGRAAEHFGHDPKEAGKKAAKDLKEGKITKEEFKDKYQQAKDINYGKEFKKGFAEEASK